ncbi:twin-arginine translocation signal domain-containing protein, partial [Mesorhizobium sp. M4B.F.Ca.ET.088.02.2.1]
MTKRIGTGTTLKGMARRDFLARSALTAGLLVAARKLLPSGAYAATAAPEVTGAKLGFIALTDAAPLM